MQLKYIIETDLDIAITNIENDSRKVIPGTLFFCNKGLNKDGHDYVMEAINKGAVAIVSEKKLDIEIPNIVVKDSIKELSKALSNYYDNVDTKLKLIGVTGTDGKTTTSTIIYQLINKLNKKCGVIGSNGILCPDYEKENNHTTPMITDFFESLDEFYKHGCEYASIEVTSERLLTNMLDDIQFDVAILTNITQDHLNSHKTMENYIDCKLKLFNNIKKNGLCILNCDDKYFDYFKQNCPNKVITYGINNTADIMAKNISINKNNMTFDIIFLKEEYHIKTNISGLYNVYNIMASIIVLNYYGFEINDIIQMLETINKIEGRSDFIECGQEYNIIIDYAHTTNALNNLLEYVKSFTKGKIITVTGSAGGRDKSKRASMGQVVTDLSDCVIFTTDDPRYEDPKDIINDMVEMITKNNYEIIIDRKDAIYKALNMATDKDSIIIAGRGNDDTMPVRDKLIKFIDKEVVESYFNEV